MCHVFMHYALGFSQALPLPTVTSRIVLSRMVTRVYGYYYTHESFSQQITVRQQSLINAIYYILLVPLSGIVSFYVYSLCGLTVFL